MPKVNPEILRWARETAGISEQDAALKLGIGKARGLQPIDRLRALEAGSDVPSRTVLVKMATVYHRPLLTFYLATPPRPGDKGHDFRSLPHDSRPHDEPLLDALIRDVRARQSLMRSAILDDDSVDARTFIGSASIAQGVQRLVASIRTLLQLDISEYRSARSTDDAFSLLRTRVERAGVYVILAGDLGSHHTRIGVDTFRGFALADDIAPFIIMNDQDHHAAWSFTLLHELAHLYLGQTGVSGGRPESRIEKFCNDVASEFLLPKSELTELRDIAGFDVNAAAARIGEFALARRVSHSMVAYKLYRVGTITGRLWSAIDAYFHDRWRSQRERERKRRKEAEGGPNYYTIRRQRLGRGLVDAAARLLAAGAMTTTKAGTVLGVKPGNVQKLIGNGAPGAS